MPMSAGTCERYMVGQYQNFVTLLMCGDVIITDSNPAYMLATGTLSAVCPACGQQPVAAGPSAPGT